jgi:hypothetical protein
MCPLPNTTGSFSSGETPGEAGDFAMPSSGKAFYQDLIRRANSVPITRLFKYYRLRVDEINRKIICPIPSHSGGRENSASFHYYPQTNTFWCFGCKTGVGCCELVAAMEGISKAKAAFKIIDLFNGDVSDEGFISREDFSEKLEVMLDFSACVREFRLDHIDEESQSFIDHICSVYDDLNLKHKTLNNEALRRIVEELKEEINSYKPCRTL